MTVVRSASIPNAVKEAGPITALIRFMPALRQVALIAAGWTLLAAFMTLARLEDMVAAGRPAEFWPDFLMNLPYFIPLMLLSIGLQFSFQRWPSQTQDTRRSVLLFGFIIFCFLPAYILFEAVLDMWWDGKGFADLGSVLANQRRFGWWIDGMIVIGATAFHYGIASRARLADREHVLHRQQNENLELRLSLLQSQLEPHFLFNALNSIAALVRTGDRPLALEVLEQLSELLRYALRASRAGFLTMQDELEFTDRYLSIQAMRYGDRLAIDRTIEDIDWAGIECPPLLFQPLVENALRHGIETTPGSNGVTLSAFLDGDEVRVDIANDIDPNSPAKPGNGMGLSLVRDRLKAVYGPRGRLETFTTGNCFTASIRFPSGDHDA